MQQNPEKVPLKEFTFNKLQALGLQLNEELLPLRVFFKNFKDFVRLQVISF